MTPCEPQETAGCEMPIEFSIDKDKGVRFHVCSETVTCDDIIWSISQAYLDEHYESAPHALWDFRNASGDLSAEDMQKIITHAQKAPGFLIKQELLWS